MTRFSVGAVAPEARSLHWSKFVSGIFFPMSASFAAPDRFHGTIENWDLGRISLSRFCSGAVCYDRAKSHLHGRAGDDFLVTFATVSDARFIQGGYDLHCRRNEFFIERGDLPYQFSHADDNELWVLKVPGAMLKGRVRVVDRHLSYVHDAGHGLGALFLDTARGIPTRIARPNAETKDGLGCCLLDLLCLALEDDPRAIGSRMSSVRLAHLARIERYVRRNLARPSMTIEEIACANGVSVRYLHDLFTKSGTSIGQWIRLLRLEAAFNDLQAARRKETIAEIAYRWGFGGQAQFSRQFKAHFGTTPRALRVQSRQSA
jgi:AraC-like DNA-binding protein